MNSESFIRMIVFIVFDLHFAILSRRIAERFLEFLGKIRIIIVSDRKRDVFNAFFVFIQQQSCFSHSDFDEILIDRCR